MPNPLPCCPYRAFFKASVPDALPVFGYFATFTFVVVLIDRHDDSPKDRIIFHEGEMPKKMSYPIAKIGIHGNGYATKPFLEQELREKAASIGADLVTELNFQVSNDEILTTGSSLQLTSLSLI